MLPTIYFHIFTFSLFRLDEHIHTHTQANRTKPIVLNRHKWHKTQTPSSAISTSLFFYRSHVYLYAPKRERESDEKRKGNGSGASNRDGWQFLIVWSGLFTFCSQLLMMLFAIHTYRSQQNYFTMCIIAGLNARLIAKRLFHFNEWFFALPSLTYTHINNVRMFECTIARIRILVHIL